MQASRIVSVLVSVAALSMAGAAHAEFQWGFSQSNCSGAVNLSSKLSTGSTAYETGYTSCSSTGAPTTAPDVVVKAYSNTNGTDGTNNGATQKIDNAYIGVYSSAPVELGVLNKDYKVASTGKTVAGDTAVDTNEFQSPEHAMDNNERFDSMVFSFAEAIKLTKVEIGWKGTDSDITILAYTGALNADGSIPSAKLLGLSYSQLIANGWTFINDYANLVVDTAAAVNAGAVYAKHWMIGAYNPLGGTVKSGFDIGNDAVKVKYLFGDKSTSSSSGGVPEPASLLLVGLALAAMGRLRKQA